MYSNLQTTKLTLHREALMQEKFPWFIWLAGVVISAAAAWFVFSLSGRLSIEGTISGGSGSQPQVASHSSDRQPNSELQPNQVQSVSGGRLPQNNDQNVTALWISERSGMPYFFDDTDTRITIFTDGPNHHKMQVGQGKRSGRHLTLQFHSTLDGIDGVLELELSDDGKTLNGFFRGLDPTKEGRVRLLRSTKK